MIISSPRNVPKYECTVLEIAMFTCLLPQKSILIWIFSALGMYLNINV